MEDFLPFWFLLFIFCAVAIWGLALGSFTTCVIYRIPRKLSLWRGQDGSYRSFCPTCHAELHAKDLIPVFSWLIQKGRCRYCQSPIPSRYLWVELVVLIAVLLLFHWFGISLWFFLLSLILPIIAGFVSFLLFRGKF